jgi:predicted GNAT family acetyltransferase
MHLDKIVANSDRNPSSKRGSAEFSILNNPIWQALSTAHAFLAEGTDLARRYPPLVGPLAGIREESEEAFEALSALLHPSGAAGLFLDSRSHLPHGWQILQHTQLAQMVCESPARAVQKHPVQELQSSDLPQMVSLAELTKPGPFHARTPELGLYLGIRCDGKLVAMAGERLHLPGFTEVSAVCTHPEYQGRGYASSLVSALVLKIMERGEIPFLHVRADNKGAIRVYERLGFETRRLLELVVLKRAT